MLFSFVREAGYVFDDDDLGPHLVRLGRQVERKHGDACLFHIGIGFASCLVWTSRGLRR